MPILGSHQIKNISKPVRVYGNFSRIPSTSPIAKRRPFFDTADDKSALITGGCLCGDVRYEISKPAIDIGYCHCKMCQRFSGAPVIFGATYPIEAVQFTQGEPTYYKSSPIAERGFCKRCGSSLTYKPLARRWTDWIFDVWGYAGQSRILHPRVAFGRGKPNAMACRSRMIFRGSVAMSLQVLSRPGLMPNETRSLSASMSTLLNTRNKAV